MPLTDRELRLLVLSASQVGCWKSDPTRILCFAGCCCHRYGGSGSRQAEENPFRQNNFTNSLASQLQIQNLNNFIKACCLCCKTLNTGVHSTLGARLKLLAPDAKEWAQPIANVLSCSAVHKLVPAFYFLRLCLQLCRCQSLRPLPCLAVGDETAKTDIYLGNSHSYPATFHQPQLERRFMDFVTLRWSHLLAKNNFKTYSTCLKKPL